MIKDLWNWENTQARKDAQMSNPATPMTPTNSDIATQPTDRVVTSDPTNGGVVPGDNAKKPFDINALNRGLSMAGIGKQDNDLAKSYGISGNGVAEEETTGLPSFLSDPEGNTYERKIKKATNEMDEAKKTRFFQDMKGIDLQKKQPNSGSAIHPDIGGSFQDTTDLADGFMRSTQILNNKALTADGSIAKFKWAYDAFSNALQQSAKLDPVSRTSAIQESLGELKMAMIPLVDKSKGIVYAQEGGRTAAYDRLDSFGKELSQYEKLYKSSSEDIQNTIKSYQEQDNKFSVAYQKLDFTQKSENAKSRLRSNKAYTAFMDVMVEANPEMKPIISGFMNASTITDDEKAFLEKNFIGGSFKELFDTRAQAIKDFWPSAAAWFKDFEDIISVKNELYKTRMDDITEGMKAPVIDPNQLMFYINKGY